MIVLRPRSRSGHEEVVYDPRNQAAMFAVLWRSLGRASPLARELPVGFARQASSKSKGRGSKKWRFFKWTAGSIAIVTGMCLYML